MRPSLDNGLAASKRALKQEYETKIRPLYDLLKLLRLRNGAISYQDQEEIDFGRAIKGIRGKVEVALERELEICSVM